VGGVGNGADKALQNTCYLLFNFSSANIIIEVAYFLVAEVRSNRAIQPHVTPMTLASVTINTSPTSHRPHVVSK